MLDPKLLRESPNLVKDNLSRRKNKEFLEMVDKFIEFDNSWRKLDIEVNKMRMDRNQNAKKIRELKGDEKNNFIKEMQVLNELLSEKEKKLNELFEERKFILDRIPNMMHESVPYGEDDESNVEIKTWGEINKFSFDPKDHHELLEILDIAELERARKTSGARFYFLKNEGVILEMALLRYAMDIMLENGRELFSTSSMVRAEMLYGSGFLPLGKEDIYNIENEDLHLIGTSEVTLAGMHSGEVFTESQLPVRYAGFSPCFRTEASSTTKDDKGIFRVHEFKKIEMFSFTKPENSYDEHENLINLVELVFQGLELPYRVVNICTGDLGGTAAKKLDVEVWYPGQKRFREVASCSNCTDYQSRRLMIRYREKEGAQIKGYVHTLNSTAITTTRPIVAILENFQLEDGTVMIPKVLQKYTGFDRIKPKK